MIFHKKFYEVSDVRVNIFNYTPQIMQIILFLLICKNDINNTQISLTYFVLPKKIKKTTFLRAPYKNKLAQLSISRIQYKYTISIKFGKLGENFKHNIKFNDLFRLFSNSDLSSTHSKHTRTHIFLQYNITNNFYVKNYK